VVEGHLGEEARGEQRGIRSGKHHGRVWEGGQIGLAVRVLSVVLGSAVTLCLSLSSKIWMATDAARRPEETTAGERH
jgi:hypothetical protein